MTPPPGPRARRRLPAAALRRLGALLVLAGLLAALPAAAGAQTGEGPEGALVDVIEIEGVLERTVDAYLADAVAEAAADGAEVLVVQLDTPGAVNVDVDAMVDRIAEAPLPVAVWVGPLGARVAGAGALLADAADVVAVAPGTVLGPREPADLAAAGAAERDAAQPAALIVPASVPEGAAIPEGAALPGGVDPAAVAPVWEGAVVAEGVADVVGASLPDVLAALDGETATVDGQATTLAVDHVTARVRFNNMGLLARILNTVSDPALAYLLVVAGLVCMLFELYQPGFGVAGITGAVLALLGLYGLWVLPVTWWAAALVVAGLLLLALDLSVGGLGALTVSGTAALAVGSWFLFPGPEPLALSTWVIAPVVAACVIFFVVVMTIVLRAQGNPIAGDPDELVGKQAVVRSMLNPEGHVFVDGALWRARAPEDAGRVKTGRTVRVVGVDAAQTLEVTVEDASAADDPVASSAEQG